ncbi:MAG: EAL domain-containing protein [Selenomonas sp.]|nr:EAL domain-containing protein [Selenomonas sp.]
MKIKNWLAAVVSLFLLFAPLSADAASGMRVGVMVSDPQFFSMKEDGEPYGYAYEYMELIAQYKDWQLIFLPGTVDECRSRLLSGSIDMIAGLPPGQGKDFTLSPLSMCLMQRNFLQPLHLTVSSRRPTFAEEVLSAEQEMRLDYPHILDYLSEKYFHHEDTHAPLILTLKEAKFLKEHPVLRLALPDGSFPVLEERDGKLAGLDAELLERISSDLGVSFELVRVKDRAAAYEALKEDKVDLVVGTPLDFAWAQKENFYLTTSYTRANYLEVTRRGETGRTGTVALPQGLLSVDTLIKHISEKDILWCQSPEDCLDAVRDGRADRTFMEAYSSQYHILHNGYYDLSATGDIVCSLDIGLAVQGTPEGRQLLSVLNHDLNSLPSNFRGTMDTRGIFQGKMQTFSAFVYNYPMQVFTGLMALLLALCLFFFYLLHIRRRHVAEIQKAAYTDYWSELPNWRWFVDEIPELLKGQLAKSAAAGRCYVLRVDIESINQLSTSTRKAIIDEQLPRILKVLQTRLKLRATAVSGMAKMIMALGEMPVSGNERPPMDSLVEQVSITLRGIIRQETAIELQAVNLTGGICRLEKAEELETAVHRAELAISEAYEAGRLVCVYDEKLEKQLARRQLIEAEMEQALQQREFEVWFQPKYDLNTHRTTGAEALVRWKSSKMGFMPPGEFINIFEENGFIIPLDNFVLEETCAMQERRRNEGKKTVPISVNQSRMHFLQDGYMLYMKKVRDTYNLRPGLVELELTETAFSFIDHPDRRDRAIRIISTLHRLGFQLSMDDFGSGYSSLELLNILPLDVMKIDRTLITGPESNERMRQILTASVELGQRLGMTVLCEGIENETQEEILKECGCQYGQGYLYSKPMPMAEFEKFLDEHG